MISVFHMCAVVQDSAERKNRVPKNEGPRHFSQPFKARM